MSVELTSHKDPAILQRENIATMIKARTIEEQKVESWNRVLLSMPKDKVLDKIPFDCSNLTLKEQVPEVYKDNPCADIVEAQIAAFNEKIDIINSILQQINAEGEELHREFKALYGGV